MAQAFKVVVVGAGIGGLTCAIASRRQGLDVVVLERAEKLTPVGAGIQIPPNASRIWAHYGLLDRLRQYSVVSEATQLKGWKTGELLCSRNIGEALDKRWPWLVIHRADYQQVLVEECGRLGVQFRFKADVQDVDFENAIVTIRDGERISGDVVIGADGLWSTLRNRLLGHESSPQATGDLAYRATFSLSALQALEDPAIDELCRQSIVTMWIGPDGHTVFYPVRSGAEFNLVVTRPDDLPLEVKTKEGDVHEMRAVFEDWDPVLRKILTAFSSVLKWKLMHHDELTLWTKENFALLGDACHPSLPYQAQGAAMAVEDGTIIATLLGLHHQAKLASRPNLSLPETLKLYEMIQKTRTTTLQLGSISNQQMYHLHDGPRQEKRDQILKTAKWQEKPEGETEPFIWIDVRYQIAIVDRDAIREAEKGWEELIGNMGDNKMI